MGLFARGRLHLPVRGLRRRGGPGLQARPGIRHDRALRDPQDRGNPSAFPRVTTIRKAMRTMNPVHESTSCAVAACAEIIGAKWTAPLVHALSEGARRFTELEHSCAGISPRTLSERLRALEDEGLVLRRSYAESPPRVEYELTAKGDALLPIIEEMRRFGHAFLTDCAEPPPAPPRASLARRSSPPTSPCPGTTALSAP